MKTPVFLRNSLLKTPLTESPWQEPLTLYLMAITNQMKSEFGKHDRLLDSLKMARLLDRNQFLRPRFKMLHPQISKLIRHNISFRLWLLDFKVMRDMTVVFSGLGSEPKLLLLRDELLGVMRRLASRNSVRQTEEATKEKDRQGLFKIAKELQFHEHTHASMKGRPGGGKGIQKWRDVGLYQPSRALMRVKRTLSLVEALSLERATRGALIEGVNIYNNGSQKLRDLGYPLKKDEACAVREAGL